MQKNKTSPLPFKETLTSLALVLIPIFITIAIYWPGLSGPFLLDDQNNIAPLKLDSLDVNELIEVAASNKSGMLGRPVSTLSLALTQYFSGSTASAFKYTNLMIHCLIGLLLFWLTLRILLTLRPTKSNANLWAAALVTTLWLVHPLNVSTVLYAVQRMAQLSTLFTIAGILCFIIGRQALENGQFKIFWGGALGVSISLLLSILSKENGALIPLYIGALEFLIFSRITLPCHSKKHLRAFHVIWIIIPIIFGAVYFLFNSSIILSGYQLREFDLTQRLLTQVHVIFFYTKLIILPQLGDMSLYHDYFPITKSLNLATILFSIILATIIAISICIKHRHPIIALGIAWFLISHLMESTFIPLEMVFEHRNYLAAYGLLLPIAYYLTTPKIDKTSVFIMRLALILFILALLLMQTTLRAHAWSSKESLLLITEIDHPNSSRVQSELATLFLLQNNIPAGLAYLNRAESLAPLDPGVDLHKITAYCLSDTIPDNLLDNAAAKLSKNKFTPYALSGIDILIQRKRYQQCASIDANKIITLIEAALKSTKSQNMKSDTSYLHIMLARSYLLKDGYETAMQHYMTAYDTMPSSLRPLIEMCDIQIGSGHLDDAEDTLNIIIKTDKSASITARHSVDRLNALLDNARQNKDAHRP